MTGVIKRVTANFSLSIPYFNAPNWGQSFERNMDIIDAVLSTAGVVNSIVGPWANNTVYGEDDRVVDTTDNSVWQCAVAHTSAVSGTFTADRAANPTYWDAVNQSVVVREEFAHGTDYFVGDFVFDTSEVLGGIVLAPFTGDTNLRNDIANIGVIFDLKADIAQWPTTTTALGYLRRNAGNTAYETRTNDETLGDLGLPTAANVDALDYLRRNAGDTAYEARSPAETRADLDLDFYEADLSLTSAQKSRARDNIDAGFMSGFRNKIINGNFDIWQRNTSFTASGYTADRWYLSLGSGAAATLSRQAFTVGQTDVPGNPTYFLRLNRTTTGSSATLLMQLIESVATLAGLEGTFTFWMKASSAVDVETYIRQYFGTGGSPSANVDTVNEVHSLTTSWQKFTYNKTLGSINGKTIGSNNNDALRPTFVLPTAAGNVSIDIAVVSMVEGNATAEDNPFSPRHIQQELALCQRYYQKVFGTSYPGGAWSNAQKIVGGVYNVTPRATPAFTYISGNINAHATDEGTLVGWSAGYTGAALTTSSPCTAVLGVDAEL